MKNKNKPKDVKVLLRDISTANYGGALKTLIDTPFVGVIGWRISRIFRVLQSEIDQLEEARKAAADTVGIGDTQPVTPEQQAEFSGIIEPLLDEVVSLSIKLLPASDLASALKAAGQSFTPRQWNMIGF